MTIDSAKRSIWESGRCLAGQEIFALGYLAVNMPTPKPILLQFNTFMKPPHTVKDLSQGTPRASCRPFCSSQPTQRTSTFITGMHVAPGEDSKFGIW